jgi:phage repressor protein C with HTH and peptisase S24 domain
MTKQQGPPPFLEFANRLKSLRESRGWKFRQLYEASGVQVATTSQWERGYKDPARISDALIRAVAKAYGVDADALRYGSGISGAPVRESFAEEPAATGEVKVVVYDLRASAGSGETPPDFIETREPHTFKQSWLSSKRLSAKNLRVITVSGDSMQPHINPGDKIVVDTADTIPASGHVYVVWYGADIRVKRITRERDGSMTLESENPKYKPETFKGKELRNLKIYGRVRDRSGDWGL